MKKGIYALIALMITTSCQSGLSGLKGNEYQLTDTSIKLAFSDEGDRFYGQAVNNYFGSYTVTPDNGITFSTVGTTMMMGPANEMQAEQKYLNDLAQVTSYTLIGNQLILTLNGGGTLTFDKTGRVSE